MYRLAGAGLELGIDSARGHVVRFALDGESVLLDADVSPAAFGCVLTLSLPSGASQRRGSATPSPAVGTCGACRPA